MASDMDTTKAEVLSDDETPGNAETAVATTNPEQQTKRVKKVKVKKAKKRPARAQVDRATFKMPTPEASGTIYNIWYNKQSGGDSDQQQQFAAPSRCNIARDAGYTRADAISGSFFCLWFARGLCWRGKDCDYLHRLPGLHDIFNPNVDCFGRDRFADYRSDMGGVGSFMRPNRTLYVGRIHDTPDVEEVVARHFAEWGQIEKIRVLNNRGVAFVTYSNVASSEFAKEAMAHQALDNQEVLNVRWATVDPNPAAQKREAQRIEEQAAEAIRRALPPEYVAALEGRDADSRKRRKVEGSFGLEGYEAPDNVWYEKLKSDWVAEQQGIGHTPGPAAIESAHDPAHDPRLIEEGPSGQTDSHEHEEGGILPGATLAALKRNQAARLLGTAHEVARKPSTPMGPLVGYGSDSEDDQ
jgi:hypothetical protein